MQFCGLGCLPIPPRLLFQNFILPRKISSSFFLVATDLVATLSRNTAESVEMGTILSCVSLLFLGLEGLVWPSHILTPFSIV